MPQDIDIKDELPVYVKLDFNIHQCDCCGRKGLKRAINISSTDFNDLNLGVICAGRWFKLNLSGNPHSAVYKLQRKLRASSNAQISEIVQDIAEAAQEWR